MQSGKVIAINFAKTSSDGVEGMAYSIPVSNVKGTYKLTYEQADKTEGRFR